LHDRAIAPVAGMVPTMTSLREAQALYQLTRTARATPQATTMTSVLVSGPLAA